MSAIRPILAFAFAAAFALGCGDLSELKTPDPAPDFGPEDGSTLDSKEDSATSPSSISALTIGEVRSTTFTSTRHWRAFTFPGTTGQKVDLYLDGLRGLDTVVYLYKVSKITGRPFGYALASNDDTNAAGWAVKSNASSNPLSSNVLGVRLPEDRNYALVATTYRQRYTGSAELVVKSVATQGQQCSGLIAYPACPTGQFCEISVANACHGADLPGYCKPIPQMCTMIYNPVCGCDGKTYSSDCQRQGAQVQLDHTGPCAGQEGDTCGSRGNAPCDEGLFCSFPAGTCGRTDGGGTCTKRPEMCTMLYSPVCGCDGQTYSNSCHASSAGISFDYPGACSN